MSVPCNQAFRPVRKQFQKDVVEEIPYTKQYDKSRDPALQPLCIRTLHPIPSSICILRGFNYSTGWMLLSVI